MAIQQDHRHYSLLKKNMDKTSTSYSYSQNHQDGLELEFQLVGAVLERNRCSHGRTKYYQRLAMAHRSIRRHKLVDLYSNTQIIGSELCQLVQTEQKRRKREQVFWDLGVSAEDRQRAKVRQTDFRNRLETIGKQVLEHIAEALSRLEFAGTAIFAEMARGFFLPFNAIAVAAVARLRTLLLRLGVHMAQVMPALQADYAKAFDDQTDSCLWTTQQLQKVLELFHSKSTTLQDDAPSREERLDRTLALLGLAVPGNETAATASTDSEELISQAASDTAYPQPRQQDDEPNLNCLETLDANQRKEPPLVGKSLLDNNDADLGEQFTLDAATALDAHDDNDMVLGSTHDLPQACHDMDRNHDLVRQVASKKKSLKKKRKGVEADEKDSSRGRKEKKKAKKLGSKEDFFDQLFASR
jgi:hypothetical protein